MLNARQRLATIGVNHSTSYSEGHRATVELNIDILRFAAFAKIDDGGVVGIRRVAVISLWIITGRTQDCHPAGLIADADFVMTGRQTKNAIHAAVVGLRHLKV